MTVDPGDDSDAETGEPEDVPDHFDDPARRPRCSAVAEWTIAIAITYSLILAAGAGYVFYCSIRPISIAEGYFSTLADYPWILAFLLLEAAWVIGPVLLLVLGLVAMRRRARFSWRFVAGWLGGLAASMAVGAAALLDFRLLFTAYKPDLDGSPLGPSRFAPGAPYWPALLTVGGQLAVCAVLIALIAALSREPRPQPESS
jgi:hypothetical protein